MRRTFLAIFAVLHTGASASHLFSHKIFMVAALLALLLAACGTTTEPTSNATTTQQVAVDNTSSRITNTTSSTTVENSEVSEDAGAHSVTETAAENSASHDNIALYPARLCCDNVTQAGFFLGQQLYLLPRKRVEYGRIPSHLATQINTGMDMDSLHYEKMQAALEKWGPVPAALKRELEIIFQPTIYQKGSHLASLGSTLNKVCFVVEGLLRFYSVDEAGKEWNKGFAVENDLTGSFTSQSRSWPAPHGLQALEETMLLHVAESDFQILLTQSRAFEQIVHRYTEALLKEKSRRLQIFQQYDAANRYLDMLERQPNLVARLPQYHIASYLGISDVSLSRICSNLARSSAGTAVNR